MAEAHGVGSRTGTSDSLCSKRDAQGGPRCCRVLGWHARALSRGCRAKCFTSTGCLVYVGGRHAVDTACRVMPSKCGRHMCRLQRGVPGHAVAQTVMSSVACLPCGTSVRGRLAIYSVECTVHRLQHSLMHRLQHSLTLSVVPDICSSYRAVCPYVPAHMLGTTPKPRTARIVQKSLACAWPARISILVPTVWRPALYMHALAARPSRYLCRQTEHVSGL